MLPEQVSSSDPSVRRSRWSGQSRAPVVLDAGLFAIYFTARAERR
jgi:hypothetical protein